MTRRNDETSASWLRWVVAFISLLALGSYGYTYTAVGDINNWMDARLSRIEAKLDCALGLKGSCN